MGKRRKPGRFSRKNPSVHNGFALEPALLMLSLVLLLSAYVCASLRARSALIQASDRSTLDLEVIERARQYAGECSWSRRCSLQQSASSFHETIQHKDVLFRDEKTFVSAAYSDRGESYRIEVYYDEGGIVRVEYR